MEANEIRVGNWLNDTRKFNKDTREFFHINENGYFKATARHIQVAELFDPIPLTEEILLKCGFEYIKELYSYCDKKHNIYISTTNEFIFCPFCTNDSSCLIKIKHLHQLQNLYFALTGTELEIKL